MEESDVGRAFFLAEKRERPKGPPSHPIAKLMGVFKCTSINGFVLYPKR